MRRVTAKNLMIAIRIVNAVDLSCSNQNAHAFRSKSSVAKMKMSRSYVAAMTKMMFANWHNSIHHRFLDLLLLGLLELGLPFVGCS